MSCQVRSCNRAWRVVLVSPMKAFRKRVCPVHAKGMRAKGWTER